MAKSSMSVQDKFISNGFLDFASEFCPWLGICRVTGYRLEKHGYLRLTKIGRKTVVAAQDATACRDSLRKAGAK